MKRRVCSGNSDLLPTASQHQLASHVSETFDVPASVKPSDDVATADI